MKDIKFIESYYHNNGLQKIFQYKSNLSIYDKMRFVSTVVNTLVDDNITCISLIRDLIFNFELIDFFTDIDTKAILNIDDEEDDESNVTAPIDLMEEFIEQTDIIKILYESIDKDIMSELNKAVNDGIYYKTGVNIYDVSNSIGNLLSVIETKIKNIDATNINDFIKVISGMRENVTPEKILDAYIQSEIYKNDVKTIKNDMSEHIAKIEQTAFDTGIKNVPMK